MMLGRDMFVFNSNDSYLYLMDFAEAVIKTLQRHTNDLDEDATNLKSYAILAHYHADEE